MLRRIAIAAMAMTIAAFVLLAVDFASSFVARCLAGDHYPNNYAECAGDYKRSVHNGLIIAGFDLVRRTTAEVLTALATCVVGAFTFTLWRATDTQARLTRDVLNLSRDEFNATHRPRIRVRQVTLDRPYEEGSAPFKAGKPIYGHFEIVNVGDIEANVLIWRAFLLPGREGSPPAWPTHVDPDPESDRFEMDRPILSPGVYGQLWMKSRYSLTESGEMNLRSLAHGNRLYAIGRITYEDSNHVSRTTEFCRCWRMPSGSQVPRFYRVDDPDFEYED